MRHARKAFEILVIIGLIGTSLSAPVAQAADYDITLPGDYGRAEFRDFTEQVGLAIAYTPLAPAEPLGVLGFDLGVEITAVKIDRDESFWRVMADTPPRYLPVPKLHAQKGLPFGLDVGVVYSKVPSSNIGMFGGELKWAILKGTLATPALAIRATYTTLTGVDDLDLSTYGADISVSKGFAFVTPYLGIGETWINSSADVLGFEESLAAPRMFIGAKLSLMVLSIAAEAGYSKVPSYSLRLSLSF